MPETQTKRSRRALITGAAGAAGATVAAAVAAPLTALAAGDDGKVIHVGDGFFDVRTVTVLWNKTSDDSVFAAYTDGAGTGVLGLSDSGAGVEGTSHAGAGVVGYSESGVAVHGSTGALHHPAVFGRSFSDSTGVQGVSGVGNARLPTKTGVFGYADQGVGAVGIRGHSPAGTGVRGLTASGVAMKGSGGTGRGAQFSGGKAQLRLVPSAAATHPASGAKGDLFLDSAGRLWLCKGTTVWKQFSLV